MNSSRPPDRQPADPSRREALRSLVGLSAGGLLAALGGFGYARFLETARLTRESLRLALPRLPAALAGFRIVQLSDFHIEPFTPAAFIEEAVEAANLLEPDLIVLTGDYVSTRAAAMAELVPILRRLRARHGVFASLGNHDVWSGARQVVRALESAGLDVLRNSGQQLAISGEVLYLAGLDSGWGGRPDLQRALAGAPPEVPIILLAHEPDLADYVARDGRVGLQLAGHSHGGQVRLPLLGAPVLPPLGRKYDLGLYRLGGTWLYTNRGLGSSGLPLRFRCPPELTEITLVGQEA